MKESKSLYEVWEWKRKVYEDTKKMNHDEELEYFNKSVDNIILKTGLKRKIISKNIYKLVEK